MSAEDDFKAEEAAQEEAGRRGYEEHKERVERLIEVLPVPRDEQVVFDASAPGIKLIDVIEATADPVGLPGFDPTRAFVRLPHGYASVEFLRMLFAVSG